MYLEVLTQINIILGTLYLFIKNVPALASFFIYFWSFQTQILEKKLQGSRDLNSDRWSRG